MIDFNYESAVRQAQRLRRVGYSIHADRNGYDVRHGDRYIAGATIKLPRDKPMHWRHARANLRDNLIVAVNAAIKDEEKHAAATDGQVDAGTGPAGGELVPPGPGLGHG